ncbi:SMEK domain-containing protein [Serratia aquatilis]|uniref:SMEK domain-containing protein n=1 Tax=Serratia aquatilis TaxID=1737515 RepID=A0ABV6EBD9_9GAMM
MLQRQIYMEKITNKLAVLAHKVELQTSLNLTDINIHAEFFFCELLNLVFDLSLVNANTIKANAKAIDLIDFDNRFAIQVTSTSDFKKIKHTIDGFISTDNINKIDRLVVLMLTKKKKYHAKTYGSNFTISIKDDIWDYTDIIKAINALMIDKIKKIHDYLEFQIPEKNNKAGIPKEVNTILGMIKILSIEDHPMIGNGFLDEPDPQKKINKRFSDYADYLMGIYVSLISTYAGILAEISSQSDAGTLNINKISAYLKRFSDANLDECEGDPVKALNKMTEYYAEKLIADGIDYDDSAIQYYLIDNMVRCNVFPNKVSSIC